MKYLMITITILGVTTTASAFAETDPPSVQSSASATQTALQSSQQVPSYSQPIMEKTRAQVYQELVQAKKDGSLAIMNKTYVGQ